MAHIEEVVIKREIRKKFDLVRDEFAFVFIKLVSLGSYKTISDKFRLFLAGSK